MSKVLRLPRGEVRIVPTTTTKLAERMLAAAATVADHLPYAGVEDRQGRFDMGGDDRIMAFGMRQGFHQTKL